MFRRWWLLLPALSLLAILGGCEIGTPPPIETPAIQEAATPSYELVQPTPIPWPEERLAFPYLGNIWLADRGAPYVLTVGDSPVLSPDGLRLAYLLPVSPTLGTRQVYVLELASGQISLVSGPPDFYGPPAWSPDGSAVAYINGPLLVVSDPRGEVQRPVATDVGAAGPGTPVPAWSGDGRRIVCPLMRIGAPELFAVEVGDGAGVRVSYTGGFSSTVPFVVLSQDTTLVPKDTVLYVNAYDGGSLWAAALDGTSRQRVLPELDHIQGLLRLSGDGMRLAGLRRVPGESDYTLWIADLMIDRLYTVARLSELPALFSWSKDGRSVYWVSQAVLYRYSVAAGPEQQIAALPPPTPTPTPTPLPVPQRLIYYLDNAFYRATAYGAAERFKEVPPSLAVPVGYSLYGETVIFPSGADIYQLGLIGGVPRVLYTLQGERLVNVELTWSLQGMALLYSAAYDDPSGRRVDAGIIRLNASTEVLEVRRFVSLTAYSGALPLLYDEASAEAFIVPWSGSRAFNRLDAYNVETGEVRSAQLRGEWAAAISPDRRWVATTTYDRSANRGNVHIFDLATSAAFSRTYALQEGTYTAGPLRWSADSRHLAFVALKGRPGEVQGAQGLWVLLADTLESSMVMPLDKPQVFLVGWDKP